jgi:DNA-directed RNA polymerase alpha subunit
MISTKNILLICGIKTSADLINADLSRIENTRNCGPKTLNEIKDMRIRILDIEQELSDKVIDN